MSKAGKIFKCYECDDVVPDDTYEMVDYIGNNEYRAVNLCSECYGWRTEQAGERAALAAFYGD